MLLRRSDPAIRALGACALVLACGASHGGPVRSVSTRMLQPAVMRTNVRDFTAPPVMVFAPRLPGVRATPAKAHAASVTARLLDHVLASLLNDRHQSMRATTLASVASKSSESATSATQGGLTTSKPGTVGSHNHPFARVGFSLLVGLAIVLSVAAYTLRRKPPPEPPEAPRTVASPPPAPPRPAHADALFPPPTPGRPAAVLVSEAPLHAPIRYAIEKPNVRIGADDASDLVLRDDSVSRRHANIRFESGVLYLSDLGSRNGTFLNGARLLHVAALQPADRIGVGRTEWRVLRVKEAPVPRGTNEAFGGPAP